MGLLRFLLALVIAIGHENIIFGGFGIGTFMGSTNALQAFFIISGFYMAMILNEKYFQTEKPYRTFLFSRWLRIYPLYWVVLILSILLLLFSAKGGFNISDPQHSIIGQPYIFAFAHYWLENIFLFTTFDYFYYIPGIYQLFIVSQAWTLGLELTFYLIAPFLAKLNTKYLSLIFIFSVVLHIYFTHPIRFFIPSVVDRIFVVNLFLFIGGMLGYKIYVYIRKKNNIMIRRLGFLTLFVCLIYCFGFMEVMQIVPWLVRVGTWVYFIVLFFSIPFIFRLTKDNKIDRFLGDLSYPLYISHFLVLNFVHQYLSQFTHDSFQKIGLLATCVLVSVGLFYVVVVPFERYRTKIVHKSRTSS